MTEGLLVKDSNALFEGAIEVVATCVPSAVKVTDAVLLKDGVTDSFADDEGAGVRDSFADDEGAGVTDSFADSEAAAVAETEIVCCDGLAVGESVFSAVYD